MPAELGWLLDCISGYAGIEFCLADNFTETDISYIDENF